MADWKQEIRQRLAGLKLQPTRQEKIVAKLAQQIEDRFAEFLAGGATEMEAQSTAFAEVSESDLLRQELRWVGPEVKREPVVIRWFRCATNERLVCCWFETDYLLRTPTCLSGRTESESA